MTNHPPTLRMLELLELLWNEAITQEQHVELEQILMTDPAAMDAYLEAVDVHYGLNRILQADGPEESQLVPLSTSKLRKRTQRKELAASFALIVTILCTLLGAIWLGNQLEQLPLQEWVVDTHGADLRFPQRHRSSNLALLTEAAGAELFGEVLPSLGSPLQSGREYALTAGMIKLSFPDGAEVILEAPSVIEIAGRDLLRVKVGRCSVHAPDGAEGFRVETPQSEITDLGTRFSVSVSEVGETDVQVIEGAAEVRPTVEETVATGARTASSTGTSRNAGSGEAFAASVLKAEQARRISDLGTRGMTTLPFDSGRYRDSLPDRVVRYDARNNTDSTYDLLLSITVQRGGSTRKYLVEELIGSELIHFRSGNNHHNIIREQGSEATRSNALDNNWLLQSGIINPGGSVTPLSAAPVLGDSRASRDELTPGMAVRFATPVTNGPGADVVLFEIQSVVDPQRGDAFHVTPLPFESGRRSTTVTRYDITMTSADALPVADFDQLYFEEPPHTPADLDELQAGQRQPAIRFQALAVGIDLSDLGLAEGETVEGLFIQDALDDDHMVDPVIIAGLPLPN